MSGVQIDALPHDCGSKRVKMEIGDTFYSVKNCCTWEVLGVSPVRSSDRRVLLRCSNEVGEIKDYRPSVLMSLKSERKKFEGPKCKDHPYYAVYSSMKTRCYNPEAEPYRWYGARGITVCDRWLQSFWNFVEDMGERPEGFTLERLDNNKNYSPDNCVWASVQDNNKNRRPNSGWKKCREFK